jgi:hypothetical protein
MTYGLEAKPAEVLCRKSMIFPPGGYSFYNHFYRHRSGNDAWQLFDAVAEGLERLKAVCLTSLFSDFRFLLSALTPKAGMILPGRFP